MDIALSWSLWDRITLVAGIYTASIMFWHWTLVQLLQVPPVRKGERLRRTVLFVSFIPLAPVMAAVSLAIYLTVIFAEASHLPQAFNRFNRWRVKFIDDIDTNEALRGLTPLHRQRFIDDPL